MCLLIFVSNANSKQQSNYQALLTVAVASNFYYPLTRLLDTSKDWGAHNIRLVSGSSGVLYAQIVNGAPYHVFLSADAMRPQILYESGKGLKPISYAKGRLVLWPADPASSAIENLSQSAGRIAIANPQTAPFGAAALDYLSKIPKYAQLKSRLVYGNNIAQAFQFVDTGNASIGLIAKSMLIQAQAKFPDKQAHYAMYIAIDDALYPEILQQAIVLTSPKQDEHALAAAFMAFLLSTSTQEQLSSLGYQGVSQ